MVNINALIHSVNKEMNYNGKHECFNNECKQRDEL